MAALGWLGLAFFVAGVCLAGVGVAAPPKFNQVGVRIAVFFVASGLVLGLGLYLLLLEELLGE
jgi:hypothetical protein